MNPLEILAILVFMAPLCLIGASFIAFAGYLLYRNIRSIPNITPKLSLNQTDEVSAYINDLKEGIEDNA